MTYRPEIDGLRALAVLPVVLFHAGVAGFAGGFIGVDVFFVISGFLITSLIARDLQRGEFSFLNFWERRARRILPPLVAVVIFALVVGWFLMLPGDFEQLGESAIAQSFFASNFVFWRQIGYFGPMASEIPLLHTWSLAVEEQFYLLFPLAMFLLTRYVARLRWSFIAVGVALSFLVSVWAVDSRPEAAFYLLPTRAWELGVGSLLALWAVNSRSSVNRKIAEPASVLGIVLILAAVFIYDETTAFPGIAALPPVVGTALVVWANTNQRTRSGDLLAVKPLVGIGLISYSLYLWHWPLIVFTSYPSGSESLGVLTTVVIIGASFVAAYGSWRFVERPFRSRTLLPTRRLMLSGALASLVLVGGLGLVIQSDPGSDLRLPDGAAAYVVAEDSRSERQRDCVANQLSPDEIREAGSLCRYGDLTSDPTFLTWGDSHVSSLMPALDLLAVENGITGFHISRPNCPPILNVSSRNPVCAPHNTAVRDLVLDRGIQAVLLSGAWVGYQEHPNLLTPISGSAFTPTSSVPSTVIAEGLAETARTLMADGVEVYLVRDVPRFEFDPPRRLFGALRFGADVEEVGQDYAEYERYMAPFDAIFDQLEQEGARIIDLPGILCDGTFCPVSIESTVLYRDNNHLSIAGSEFVKSTLEPFFGQFAAAR